jgi:hypothetical protein
MLRPIYSQGLAPTLSAEICNKYDERTDYGSYVFLPSAN